MDLQDANRTNSRRGAKAQSQNSPMKFVPLKLALTACLLFVFAASCTSDRPAARRLEVTGDVVSVDKAGRVIILNHRAIPGYMRAMTMGFNIKDDWVLGVAKPGDQVQATLVVEGSKSWLEGVVLTEKPKVDPNPLTGRALRTPEPGEAVPEFALVNQDGKKIRLADYRGKTLLVTFIFTRCPLPDFCPLMSENFSAIAKKLSEDAALSGSVRLLSISIDPEYDQPPVLREYAKRYGAGGSANLPWDFATGKPDEVRRFAKFFGLDYWEESGQVIHALVTAAVDGEGRVQRIYRGNDWKPTEVIEDIRGMKHS